MAAGKPGRPKGLRGLTITQFANADGCSVQYVSNSVSRGQLIPYADGSLNPLDVGGPWRASNRKKIEKAARKAAEEDEDPPAAGQMTRTEAELAKITYDVLNKRREHDVEIGKVVMVEVSAKIVAAAYAKVRTKLLALPAELAPALALVNTAPEAQEILQRAITKALQALVDEQPGA